ncbi:MAG: rhomboid family intramembrane serine protease [Flavobacteriaceae bacterium]|nr:MAG: rhomboid family intramembrane serine protease [Flavobacteriaceae bacterium]
MEKEKEIVFSKQVWVIPMLLLVLVWIVYIIELKFDFNFNKYGIYPKSLKGLRGVFFSPFIHGDTNHLLNNSVPLVVLSACLLFFYKEVAWKVLLVGTLLSGILTWIIARENYHIGASGVIYLLFSFIFFSGVIRKNYRLVAISLGVVFLYGSMIWYVFPVKDGISWEGHLSGFVVGFIFAIIYRKIGLQKIEHTYTSSEFDTYFDDDGNLKESLEEPPISQTDVDE